MKKTTLGITIILLLFSMLSYAQKTISEGIIVYNISIQSLNNEPLVNPLNGATLTVYLKGALSRTDMVSSLGNERTIHDAKTGNAVILKEYSGQKLMITLTKENWGSKNKKSAGVTFNPLNETKEILGYTCTKATGKLSDGTIVTVNYAKELAMINKEYDPAFKNLPGLPMQYEFDSGKLKFVYTIAKIDFISVPAAKFEYPKSGYRVMTYDENRQGRKDNP